MKMMNVQRASLRLTLLRHTDMASHVHSKMSTALIKRLLVRFKHHTSLKIWIPPYKLALATGPPATILLLKNIPPTHTHEYSIQLQQKLRNNIRTFDKRTIHYVHWQYFLDMAEPLHFSLSMQQAKASLQKAKTGNYDEKRNEHNMTLQEKQHSENNLINITVQDLRPVFESSLRELSSLPSLRQALHRFPGVHSKYYQHVVWNDQSTGGLSSAMSS